MSENKKKLFLLDAYALIYRAHFAFSRNPRISSKGVNTSVAFGFLNTLLEVLQKQKPTHIAVAFDTSAPTFRHEEFKEYKANRQETPEDIRTGVPIVKDLIRAFNIPILELDGYEADDIIGTFAKKAEKQGFEVFMMTPDKDFGQLVSEHIFLYKPAYMGNSVEVMGVDEVLAKWNIDKVDQVRDVLGLHGDSSDNIPGIPGIGAKTASKLLKKYGSVEELVAHVDELKGKQKENVENFGEQGILSKRLATIDVEVPIEFSQNDMEYTGWNEEKLREILNDLEFRTISKRLFGTTSAGKIPEGDGGQMDLFNAKAEDGETETVTEKAAFDPSQQIYKSLSSKKELEQLQEYLEKQKRVSVKIFLDHDDPIEAKILGIAFSYHADNAYYVRFPDEQSKTSEWLAILKPFFSNDKAQLVGHDLKKDVVALKKYGITVGKNLFDTMLAHYLIEPDASHDLDLLADSELNFTLLSEKKLLAKQEVKKGSFVDLDAFNQSQLAGERVNITLKLAEKLAGSLADNKLDRLFYEVEIPLLYVLALMEYEGVMVDKGALGEMSKELESLSNDIRDRIYTTAGREFNINSPKQLGEVLFDDLKLVDKPKKTKSGQYATGEEILSKLASEHDIAADILLYREYQKLKSTYVDALPNLISKSDGRVHTTYSQAVAATGRLSSVNPNLQNIPIRSEMGRAIRKAFVPREGDHKLLSADYSQIELRIMAHFSKDEHMIQAFRDGKDIHAITASRIFSIPLEEVDADKRRMAKTANFGMIYGISAFGLSQNLNISRSEAAEIIDAYFKEFHAVKAYMDSVINQARENGYVETLLGRKRYLRDINSRNATMRGYSERNAINAPIQGSAADMIKIAMINIQDWIEKQKLRTRMILQVHDELVFEVVHDELETVKKQVPKLMQEALPLEVPIEVETGYGANWLEAH